MIRLGGSAPRPNRQRSAVPSGLGLSGLGVAHTRPHDEASSALACTFISRLVQSSAIRRREEPGEPHGSQCTDRARPRSGAFPSSTRSLLLRSVWTSAIGRALRYPYCTWLLQKFSHQEGERKIQNHIDPR